MQQTLEILRRRNIGVASGSMIASWYAAAPDRIIPGHFFSAGDAGTTPAELRAMVKDGRVKVFGEILNQYQGIAPDDPAFEPYLALAEGSTSRSACTWAPVHPG